MFSNFINTNVGNKISETSENIKTNSKNVNLSDNFSTTYNINESQNQKDTSTISSDLLSLTTDSTIQATDCSESILNPFSICPTTPTVPKTKQKISKRLSDFLTYNNNNKIIKQLENKTKNTKKNLPKITEEYILPKGTIKIMKVSANNKNLQNNFSEQVFLEQNEYNDTNSSVRQVSCLDNTLDSTNILKGKEYVSESIPGLNNNINLKNKNIDNKLQSTKIDHKDFFMEEKDNIYNVNANDVDSETTYEDSISNQEQSNKLDNNKECENNIVQNNKNSETNSDESILKNNSNLTDIIKSCKDNRLSIFGSKEEVTKQNRKRIAEKNATDIELNNKKKRLNRTTWLQNNITCTKLNHQQLDDFSNIDTMVTAESNIAKENYSKKQDLRECLNKKRSKLPTPENEFNNKTSVECRQIHSDIENDIITSTNTKTEEFCKCLSFNKETAFNKIYKEKDIQTDPVCNNHTEVHCYSTSESTSEETQHINQINGNIYEGTNQEDNIQKEYRTDDENKNDGNDCDDNDDCDDCISLFAESFDTTL